MLRPPARHRPPGAPCSPTWSRVSQDLAFELEDPIRRAPDQWHLLQPDWSRREGKAPLRGTACPHRYASDGNLGQRKAAPREEWAWRER